jgi:hypothetical protein
MITTRKMSIIAGWMMGIIIAIIAVLNLVYVHPVPGIVVLLVASVLFPPVGMMFRKYLDRDIPFALKIFLFVMIIWFTLGVSDLGDMID